MNNATRQTLATAVTAVDGVAGHPYRPATVRVGDAWPQWAGAARADNSIGFEMSYSMVVVAAAQGDFIEADVWIDAHLDALHDALAPVMWIEAFTPVEIPSEGGAMLGLQITGKRE